MTATIITLLSTAFGLGLATLIVPGIKSKNITSFVIAAMALSVINIFIRPALWFLTAPLSIVTFGLFALVINAFMIMLAAAIVPGFSVKNFTNGFLGAIVMAIVGLALLVAIPLLTGAEINWSTYEYQTQTFQ